MYTPHGHSGSCMDKDVPVYHVLTTNPPFDKLHVTHVKRNNFGYS